MEKETKSRHVKLTLSKTTLKNLKVSVRTGIHAGPTPNSMTACNESLCLCTGRAAG